MPDTDIDKFLGVIERMDKLKTYVYSLCAGVFMLGVLWANNTNTLNNLSRENENRKAEIAEIQKDRKETMAEWRSWRDNANKSLARIEALLEEQKVRK